MIARALSVAALLAATSAPHAVAGSVPAPVRALLEPARLAGEGTLRWFGLRIYDARLWVGPRGFDPGRLDARPFALELRYARSLSGAAIAERSAVEIQRLDLASESRHRDWRAAMAAIFPDVGAGDRIAGVFDPSTGTRFYLNDDPIGRVADPAFARAFFAIWFDRRTAAPALREALIGGAASVGGATPPADGRQR
ncbi:MAG: hypothetical protein EHM83_04675 [Burkholderiales bacterium]|nr:MAG: hypothetical protein EHM83_04675 [Burkholderiales bacterium]